LAARHPRGTGKLIADSAAVGGAFADGKPHIALMPSFRSRRRAELRARGQGHSRHGQAVPKSFVAVLDECELRGEDVRPVEVGGVPVLVARSRAGAVCALRLRAAISTRRSDGSLESDIVPCAWHDSRFAFAAAR
jgi:hypothetical protein